MNRFDIDAKNIRIQSRLRGGDALNFLAPYRERKRTEFVRQTNSMY